MHGRDSVPGKLEQAAYHFGLTAAANYALSLLDISARAQLRTEKKAIDEQSEVTPYVQLKLLLTNYQKASKQPGCFSFTTSAGLPGTNYAVKGLDISFSDLEEDVQYPFSDRFKQQKYHFDLVYLLTKYLPTEDIHSGRWERKSSKKGNAIFKGTEDPLERLDDASV